MSSASSHQAEAVVSLLNQEKEHLPWYALLTRVRFEETAATSLGRKGFETFLPLRRVRRQWSDRLLHIYRPLFPGYLFCRFCKSQKTTVLQTPGVFSILTIANELAPVDPSEIDTLKAVTSSELSAMEVPFLTTGQVVRVVAGPLRNAEGIVVRNKSVTRLVLSVKTLQRAISVEVERDWLEVA